MNKFNLKSAFRVVSAISLLMASIVVMPVVFAQDDCPSAQDSYTIGFANLTQDIEFTQLVQQGLEETAAEAGNVELIIADNRLDGATALANTENFITQGVDGIIHFQTDAAFGNVIMSRARGADIPVVAIDIPMPGAVFFGADNYYAGELAGQALAEWVNENWEGQADAVLMLELPQSGPIPAARMQGMLDAFQANVENPVPEEGVFHLDSKNTQEEAFRVVSDTLPLIPDAEHIVAMSINDGTGIGTIAAAEAAGRGDQIMVVGQNADPTGQEEMVKEDSRYLGATAYFPENYGSQLLPAMIDLLECRPVPPSVFVEHVFIGPDNLCDYYSEAWPDFCEPQS